ncbi:EAL domain-containing protein [Sphingomonas lacunae]|uniref:EAL domain-containing protein n=2 Tax=Sphingomonas lacunae TaxID=2698828 RepID=A0A6M4AWM0_9SPHN|nr:EAL domain-containing protein [Sphingomonas lacunae]
MSALRAQQIDAVRGRTIIQLLSILVGGVAIGLDNLNRQPLWMVGGYVAAVALVCGLRFFMRESRRNAWIYGAQGGTKREIALGLVTALVLTAPLLFFAWSGDRDATENAWIILAGMMAVYGFATLEVPILYAAVMPAVGVISALALTLVGNPTGAIAVLAFTFIGLGAIIKHGHDFIRYELVGRRAEEQTETVSLLLREFEDAGSDWLWQVDANRRITKASPRFAHAVGRDPSELEGLSILQLLAGEHWSTGKFPPALHDLANRLNRKESFASLLVPVALDERTRWWELSASPSYDSSGVFIGFRGVGSDVTEQRASADRIAHLARFDALTGLPNRLYLNETLAGALEQAAAWRRRCAFIMIDLDRFKAVNDTLGHPIGDRLLAQVAARMKQFGTESVIAGRLGGDEFGVVLREIDGVDTVERLGQRIIDVVSRPYEIDQHTLYVGASLGYAVGPRDGATVEALTRNADLALYRSKDQGGGVINSYEPTLHDQARERREIEIELRSALGRDEFMVHYQPVVHSDGRVDGFEALLRWNSKKLGPVSPVKFIPVAEDTRLIGPIGEWVLQTACHEAARWPSNTKVAVNVSAEQLSSPGFVASVMKALAHSGIAPNRLELEVTESVFLREVSGAMATLDQVRALGVKLVLDDFGTGYSSLGYLRMGQFSTIKVDRSFVQGALKGARESIAIVRAVVALADSLEMSTTAEGVENQEEADAIVALGCKKLQGYHFGRPMSAEDAFAIFDGGARRIAVGG